MQYNIDEHRYFAFDFNEPLIWKKKKIFATKGRLTNQHLSSAINALISKKKKKRNEHHQLSHSHHCESNPVHHSV